MNWFETILIATCVALILCPTKWDPTIRLKEWLARREGGRS